MYMYTQRHLIQSHFQGNGDREACLAVYKTLVAQTKGLPNPPNKTTINLAKLNGRPCCLIRQLVDSDRQQYSPLLLNSLVNKKKTLRSILTISQSQPKISTN